jgi:hypothetical protein
VTHDILDGRISFECDCGEVTRKSVRWLRENRRFVCTCGDITIIGPQADWLSKPDITAEDLRKVIYRINKKNRRRHPTEP